MTSRSSSFETFRTPVSDTSVLDPRQCDNTFQDTQDISVQVPKYLRLEVHCTIQSTFCLYYLNWNKNHMCNWNLVTRKVLFRAVDASVQRQLFALNVNEQWAMSNEQWANMHRPNVACKFCICINCNTIAFHTLCFRTCRILKFAELVLPAVSLSHDDPKT